MENTLIKFSELEKPTEKVFLRPIEYGGKLYGVEVRFSTILYRRDDIDFEALCARIGSRSKSLLCIMTDYKAFCAGIIYLAVNFCGHNYNPKIIEESLRFLTDEVLRSLKLSSPSPH